MMQRGTLFVSILGLAGLCAAVGPDPAPTPAAAATDAATTSAKVRGMTISCHGSGQSWGSDAMVETMAELHELGVNWITIHPYAGIGTDGTVGGSRTSRMYADPQWLTRPIEEAHRLGLKIMIKPHIAYWGTPFSWRGEITFETDPQWARFFSTYEAWVTMVAELSKDADALVVGTELGGTVHREAEWRRVIAAVRGVTDAPLTYSANWDRFEKVPFWDALDVIGIQSYFPLTEACELPEPAELDAAWTDLLADLEDYAGRLGKPIVFAELGYNLSSDASCRPWEYRTGGPDAEETQRRCMEAALRAVERSETIVGAFLWKWFPGDGRRGRRGNFIMSTPAMRDVIGRHWRDADNG